MPQSPLASEMLAKIIDGSSIPSLVIDKRHKVIYWNTAIESLSGIKGEEIIGTDRQWRAFYTEKRPTMADLILDGASAEAVEAYYQGKCKRSSLIEDAFEAEDFFSSLGQQGKWLRFTASPIRDNDGKVVGAIETLEDITERKNAEDALHESERSFRALFEGAHDAIWVHDMDGNIQTVNRAAIELSGYTEEELLNMNVKSFLDPESLGTAREISSRLLQHQPIAEPYELLLVKKDGSQSICMLTTNLITRDGEPTGFQNIARDVSQEKHMQENLHYYLQQITRAQEEERKRIARELHDDTAQVFASLSRQLDNFVRNKHGSSPGDILFLKELQGQLNQGVQSVHRLIQDLRPSLLDDLGLMSALRSLMKSVQEYEGINMSLDLPNEERRLSPEVELLLFRIAQEALNNIRWHAHASEASVVIDFTDNRVRMTISDNGCGFVLSGNVDDLPRNGKLGLAGMQERARLLGGNLKVSSTPGTGTTVAVEVPA